MEEKTVLEQNRVRSVTWWVGMVDAVVTAITGVLMAAGAVSVEIGGAVVAGSAIVLAYCNGNNPSIRGKY